mmetsp:Transcript_9011/g.13866  ORF Transcript_9011/g.13866 Transcript_9011/m.13866 type:complete len:228 (+) Transcript_9011:41-724(+)
MVIRVVLLGLCYGMNGVTSQDPLGDFYGSGPDRGPPPPPPPGPPPRQGQVQAIRPRQSNFFGSLFFLAAGAGAMKVYDMTQVEKKLKKQMDAVQTALDFKRIEAQQLSQKMHTLEYQVRELQQALYESEAESLQRDYDEFKAPDLNDDDFISAEEFAAYITNYMKAYPLISEDEYPVFSDFDIDQSGAVTFKEWQHYLQEQQKQKKDAARTSSSPASQQQQQQQRRR